MATREQVAKFYGVDHNTIKWTVNSHREELESDGMKHMKYGEIKEIVKLPLTLDSMKELGIGKVGSNIFPKRAILRVGMLLRDSEVAKEVRTQLLNIEEHTAAEVKTYEIDYEQDLHLKLGQAIAKQWKKEVKNIRLNGGYVQRDRPQLYTAAVEHFVFVEMAVSQVPAVKYKTKSLAEQDREHNRCLLRLH
ncbi:hypothetical protein COC50_19385 [Bacillus anthracis]|nr:hypothetical protein COC50_19385 [Bacillus anthracis]